MFSKTKSPPMRSSRQRARILQGLNSIRAPPPTRSLHDDGDDERDGLTKSLRGNARRQGRECQPLFHYLALERVLCMSEDGHTTTVVGGKCLIPRRKRLFKNRRAIFAILSIKNIHPNDYVSSLTVPEPPPRMRLFMSISQNPRQMCMCICCCCACVRSGAGRLRT